MPLERNLKLNGVRASVFPAAIDAADAAADAARSQIPSTSREFRSGIFVVATSIPTIIGRLGWDRIGLLKVDIAGAEPDLFSQPADWISLVDILCIKCHSAPVDIQLRELASGSGFLPPRHRGAIWLLIRPT